jgi:hypothetical protein
MPQRQHDPVVCRQMHQRAPDFSRDLGFAVLRFRVVALGTRQLDIVIERLFAPPPAQLVERLVDGDPVDPAEELVAGIVFVELLGDLEEYDLGDVVGVLCAAQYPERGVVQGPLVANDKCDESVPIAVTEALQQGPIGVIPHKYTRRSQKLARRSAGGLDLEDLVEARIAKDVLQMVAYPDQPELSARGRQALLGLEKHPETGA